MDWAAEAVDSDIIALVGKSTSKQDNRILTRRRAEAGSTGITTSTVPVTEEADRATSLWLQSTEETGYC